MGFMLARPFSDRLALAIALAIGAIFVSATWWVSGIDMRDAYVPWLEHIRRLGVTQAFSSPFSDYMPPYLYLLALATPAAAWVGSYTAVKLVSVAGHLCLALAVRHLLAVSGAPRPGSAAALITLAPSLLLNPTILVQCDAWWAAALTMALASAMREQPRTMFFWCGVAVAFKLQAAFGAPVFLAITLARRWPPRWWLIAPATLVATLVPAWAAGWPAADLASIYFRQLDYSRLLSLNAPNIWMIVETMAPGAPPALGTVGTVAATGASLGYVMFFTRRLREEGDAAALLRAACLGALIVPGLLPRMHERYFFFADVVALALVAVQPSQWRIATLVQFGSAAAVIAYIIRVPDLAALGGAAMIAATGLALQACLRRQAPQMHLHARKALPA